MKSELQITKPIADSIVKLCFDVLEFSKLYDQDTSNNPKKIFQCNDDIKEGLNWFIGSETNQEMNKNVRAYKQAVKNTLDVYKNLKISFSNKEKIISTLIDLNQHLTELEKQIK
ncbi:MAG: hypothetical protein IPL55_19295 [Saprospiraceae bacterium]|jgi:lipopolysaccharide export LptBFGC system permease protein LptF|nr:hypothetical protein [Saprospiraceae bacterium]MBL0024663.1 hypothetical protein [Saprospiraceae bacterium]